MEKEAMKMINKQNVNIEYETITESETPNVVQINWYTPTSFPLCPEVPGDNPLQEYLDNLIEDAVFAINQYGNSMVLKADFNKERNAIFVATYTDSESAVKGYALAKIEYNNTSHIYYHESMGAFFGEDGVIKYFTTERGYEWDGEEVLDDLC